jgi:radical SAM superfamily enzyme YgiQ (UPF0313 family)
MPNPLFTQVLIVDALGSEQGVRRFTRDVIGAGPRMVAGILAKFSISSRIMTAEQYLNEKRTEIQADHLFVSAMTMDYLAVKKVIHKWNNRSETKQSLRLLGGPIACGYPKILPTLKFDFAIIGEAEHTLSELIKIGLFQGDFNFERMRTVRGIAFIDSKSLIETPKAPFLTKEELNTYQASSKHVQNYPSYQSARIFIECVRGCSNYTRTKIQLPDGRLCNKCNICLAADLERRMTCPLLIPPGCGYCSVPSVYGPPRSRSILNITKEIKELLELGTFRFILGASDFLEYQREELVAPSPLTDPRYPPPNYQEIEHLLAKIAEITAGTEVYLFIENIKASLFTEKAAALIASYLPNTALSIGCETGSLSHSNMLGRSSTPKEVLQAVQYAKKYNLRVHTYFIHGLPGQNLQSAIQTSNFMKKLAAEGIEKVTVYKFKPLPMSAFSEFPTPPLSSTDKASKLIVDTAIEINRNKKQAYIGTTERVIVSETLSRDKTQAIGYPLRGGPTVLIKNAADSVNKIISVKIDGVLSDKMVAGHKISG